MNLYSVSVPVFKRMLENLKTILKKGEAHASAKGIDPHLLLEGKLAPDMFNLTRQVQIASDNAKGCSARLAGLEPPQMPDTEKTFEELYERMDKTIAFLETLKPDQFEGSEKRHIPFTYAEGKYLLGNEHLLQTSLPNFFFHVTTAYDILRHQGVELGKMDFIGELPLKNI